MTAAAEKTSWADDVEDSSSANQPEFPSTHVVENSDGTKTVIEYRINEQDQKVKLIRRIQEKVVKEHVNRAVAERKKWKKFGQEANSPPGPQLSTTTVSEVVELLLSQYAAQQRQQEKEKEEREKEQSESGVTVKSSTILCRVCRGDHFTAKCPYKDTLVPLEEITNAAAEKAAAQDEGGSQAGGAAGKGAAKSSYVPPHMRGAAGASAAGAAVASSSGHGDRRDDNPTIRITNLSEDTQEADVKQLCCQFGALARTFVATDRITGACRGYAFVSYYDRDAAQRALDKLNGYGYDNLILNAEWANSSAKK